MGTDESIPRVAMTMDPIQGSALLAAVRDRAASFTNDEVVDVIVREFGPADLREDLVIGGGILDASRIGTAEGVAALLDACLGQSHHVGLHLRLQDGLERTGITSGTMEANEGTAVLVALVGVGIASQAVAAAAPSSTAGAGAAIAADETAVGAGFRVVKGLGAAAIRHGEET